MKLEKQVCSKEHGEKLKALGVTVESLFLHIDLGNGPEIMISEGLIPSYARLGTPAYTLAELFNMMGDASEIKITKHDDDTCSVLTAGCAVIGENSLADALALTLEYRIENGWITAEEINAKENKG